MGKRGIVKDINNDYLESSASFEIVFKVFLPIKRMRKWGNVLRVRCIQLYEKELNLTTCLWSFFQKWVFCWIVSFNIQCAITPDDYN